MIGNKLAQLASDIGKYATCSGTVIFFDQYYWNEEEFVEQFLSAYNRPITLFSPASSFDKNNDKDVACSDVVLFSDKINHQLESVYNEIIRQFRRIGLVILISPSEIKDNPENVILPMMSNGNIIFVLDSQPKEQYFLWKINNEAVQHKSFEETIESKQKYSSKIERHLKIATLDHRPYIFVRNQTCVDGIEPTLIEIFAKQLNFTFDYVFPNPDEKWGRVLIDGDNVTITGIVGMLKKKNADVAIADYFITNERLPYIDFSLSYKSSYICYIVPVPKPYDKWTSLYLPFGFDIWVATGVSYISTAFTLRLMTLTQKDGRFHDLCLCFLYAFGNILGVIQNRKIQSLVNRLFLVLWICCTFVISSYYRVGFISYVTYPYTPPVVDKIEHLVETPYKIVSSNFDNVFMEMLNKSSYPVFKKLRDRMTVSRDFEYGYSLLNTSQWALQIEKFLGQYILATRFQPAIGKAPRFHQMSECLWPVLSALGLQKNSPIKPQFDQQIQRLIEGGFHKYLVATFVAKRVSPRSNKPQNFFDDFSPFALNDLQGSFYVLLFGLGISALLIIFEVLASWVLIKLEKKTSIKISETVSD